MNKSLLGVFSLAAALVLTSGCINTLDGRYRMAVPFRKDKIVSRYERSVDQVFEAAKKTLSENGILVSENTIAHTLVAKVDTRTVWVSVDQVEPTVSEIVTQVRTKMGGVDIDLASEIDKQTALHLK
jgi:outer membrane lipopolysaccharide assembly protein LptE/RlpB